MYGHLVQEGHVADLHTNSQDVVSNHHLGVDALLDCFEHEILVVFCD